jgi:penicillin-insensitive murein endopeptidase
MRCPAGSDTCAAQAPIPGDDGCGQELVDWYKRIAPSAEPKEPPAVPAKPAPPKRETLLDELPGECRLVLGAENAGEAMLDSGKAARSRSKSSGASGAKSAKPHTAGSAAGGTTAAAK